MKIYIRTKQPDTGKRTWENVGEYHNLRSTQDGEHLVKIQVHPNRFAMLKFNDDGTVHMEWIEGQLKKG